MKRIYLERELFWTPHSQANKEAGMESTNLMPCKGAAEWVPGKALYVFLQLGNY